MYMQKTVRSSLFFSPLLLLLVLIQPVLAEDFNFPGLSDTVTVYEDQWGIPSIKAKTAPDAVFMQGYMHARDRFYQMDETRKGAAGRAAELLGEVALSSDVQNRIFGLGRAALKTWQAADAETKAWLQAYANGVNTYLQNNPLPPEYTGLEITQVEPWTPLHTILVIKYMLAYQGLDIDDINNTIRLGAYQYAGAVGGFDGLALYSEDTHRHAPPDGRVTAPDFLAPLAATSTTEASTAPGKGKPKIEWIGSQEVSETTLALAKKFVQKIENAPLTQNYLKPREQAIGSNAWLISGEHTATGNPMIANDPHLILNTPAIWYESQLIFERDGEEWHVNGVNVPGLIGSMLGCNSAGCWGFTNNFVDPNDIYSEEFLTNALTLPTHTLYKGNPEPIKQIMNSYFVNVIGDGVMDNLVRGPVGYLDGGLTLTVPRRNDGPVLQIDGNTGLSAAWTGSRDTYEATLLKEMALAKDLDEVKTALQYFDGGSQNVFWADVMGNIAWFSSSEIPVREDLANFTVDGLPPWFIRDGTGAAANEWLPVTNPQPNQALDFEILPFDEMPQLINPTNGYVANANNDPVGTTLDNNPLNDVRPSGQGLYYLSPYYASYRMGRIDREVKAMIDAGHKITLDDMKALQANVKTLDAELVLPTLLGIMSQVPVPPESPMGQALDVLSTWDYSFHTGLAEGWDAGSSPTMMVAPSLEQVRNSAAATVWAMWRSMLVQNTIYATLEAIGLGDYLPPSDLAYSAFKHHLDNYPTAGGVGASGIPFFSAGLAETVAGSLQMALDNLASDEFAPAYANSTNVLDYVWGKLHRIVFDHTLGAPFNIPNWGPFMDLSAELPGLARQGDRYALDAAGSASSITGDGLNDFMFDSGPSRRFVADMGPVDVDAQQVIAGGQSGVVTSPLFGAGLSLWLTNSYHPVAFSEADAAGVAVKITTFGPPAAAANTEGEE